MKKFFASLVILLAIFSSPVIIQQPASAASFSAPNLCARSFLGFPTWYRGLIGDSTKCTLKSPTTVPGGLGGFIGRIALNVVEILAMLVGYIAVGMIIFGGFQYLTSAGSADNSKKAKTTITNAIIGLVLSLSAFAVTNLITSLWR